MAQELVTYLSESGAKKVIITTKYPIEYLPKYPMNIHLN